MMSLLYCVFFELVALPSLNILCIISGAILALDFFFNPVVLHGRCIDCGTTKCVNLKRLSGCGQIEIACKFE